MRFKLLSSGFASWILLALAPSAQATLVVTPADTSERVPVSSISPFAVVDRAAIDANSVYYYPITSGASTPVSSLIFPDTGFTVFDADATFASDSSGTARTNMITFDVRSTTASGTNLGLVIQIRAGTGSEQLVPIARAGGVDCNATSVCETAGVDTAGIPSSHRFIAKYTAGSTLRVGIYPRDLCADYQILSGGTPANGCVDGGASGGIVEVLGSGTALQHMPITFKIVPMSTTVDAAPTLTSASDSISFLLGFQTEGPTLTCDLFNTALYFPGDSQILLDTSLFSLTPAGTNRAPGTHVVMVAKDGGTPDATSTFDSGTNTLVKRVLRANVQPISGFTNTTDNTDHAFQAQFMMRDASGLLSAPDGVNCSSSVLQPVRTAAIEGLLARSSCFIASAAFADPEAEPVRWLRGFRDTALLKTSWGRSFVATYYRYSPAAARWLLYHPWFRLPVLYALVPFEVMSWLWLQAVALW